MLVAAVGYMSPSQTRATGSLRRAAPGPMSASLADGRRCPAFSAPLGIPTPHAIIPRRQADRPHPREFVRKFRPRRAERFSLMPHRTSPGPWCTPYNAMTADGLADACAARSRCSTTEVQGGLSSSSSRGSSTRRHRCSAGIEPHGGVTTGLLDAVLVGLVVSEDTEPLPQRPDSESPWLFPGRSTTDRREDLLAVHSFTRRRRDPEPDAAHIEPVREFAARLARDPSCSPRAGVNDDCSPPAPDGCLAVGRRSWAISPPPATKQRAPSPHDVEPANSRGAVRRQLQRKSLGCCSAWHVLDIRNEVIDMIAHRRRGTPTQSRNGAAGGRASSSSGSTARSSRGLAAS